MTPQYLKCGKGIDYAHYTWNPTGGCTHRCPWCWARRFHNRRMKMRGGPEHPFEKPKFYRDRLDEPAKIKHPAIIAVSFMGDLFDPAIKDETIKLVTSTAWSFTSIRAFLYLTKRPERFSFMTRADEINPFLYDNFANKIWIGTSAEDQKTLAARMKRFPSGDKCGNRYVSLEPLLGPVDLSKFDLGPGPGKEINWVIVGAQTGPGAMYPLEMLDWMVDIKNQCRSAKVPVFFKRNTLINDAKEFPSALQRFIK